MSEQEQIGGRGLIQLALRIECFDDRPGIYRVWHGEKLLFEEQAGQPVTHLGLRMQIGFHSHIEPATFALIWREQS
jgi:hypothetical protein